MTYANYLASCKGQGLFFRNTEVEWQGEGYYEVRGARWQRVNGVTSCIGLTYIEAHMITQK